MLKIMGKKSLGFSDYHNLAPEGYSRGHSGITIFWLQRGTMEGIYITKQT